VGGLRYALLPMAGAVYYLADLWKYDAARWLLGIITFMLVAPDVRGKLPDRQHDCPLVTAAPCG
jgi:hypothetical protein